MVKKTIRQVSETVFFREVVEEYHLADKRFTLKQMISDLQKQLGYDRDERPCKVERADETVIVKAPPQYHRIYEVLIRTLNRDKDDDGHRIYIHSIDPVHNGDTGPTWFHRDQSTPQEQLDFGLYLIKNGKLDMDEGRYQVRQARKRMEAAAAKVAV